MKNALLLGLLATLALAGCGDDQPVAVQSFAPLHYDYLPKLRLNVGSIDIQDHSLPAGPQDVAATSPAVPSLALAQMAHDRLFAAGVAGQATFVIDQASILREPNGTLDGQMAVHLDMTTQAGTRGGFAEARVARQFVPGSDEADLRSELYNLTRQMMDDMNVEFEFQVRRTLPGWLVSAGDAPAPVVAQPLAAPQAAPLAAAPPALPPALPPTEPQTGTPPAPADAYQDPALPPPPPQPPQMSPPPGFLQAPPGTSPALPPGNGYQ